MRGYAFLLQHLHHIISHTVIDNALSYNGSLLLPVECGGVVLIIHDQHIRILGLVHLFCFSLIEQI